MRKSLPENRECKKLYHMRGINTTQHQEAYRTPIVQLHPMKIVYRFLFPVVVLIFMGYYVTHSISNMGASMAEKTTRDGIAVQVRYHMGTIKDGDACSDLKTRIGRVLNVETTAEATPQLLALSNEARAKGCLK